jgi:hypothetical protein
MKPKILNYSRERKKIVFLEIEGEENKKTKSSMESRRNQVDMSLGKSGDVR